MDANAVENTVASTARSQSLNEYLITKKAKASQLVKYPPLVTSTSVNSC